jgi:hypothetical protein
MKALVIFHSIVVRQFVRSQNNEGRVSAKSSSANRSVVITKTMHLPLVTGKRCSAGSHLDNWISGLLQGL